MSSWIDAEKKKVLERPVPLEELTIALVTDTEHKRQNYACGSKFVTLADIHPSSNKYPQVHTR